MLNISQVILVGTDSNLCRKKWTVHWSAPNSLIRSYLHPCTNSMWGDESEAVASIIWLYQTVDAQKEEIFFPDLLITLQRHAQTATVDTSRRHVHGRKWSHTLERNVQRALWSQARCETRWCTFSILIQTVHFRSSKKPQNRWPRGTHWPPIPRNPILRWWLPSTSRSPNIPHRKNGTSPATVSP